MGQQKRIQRIVRTCQRPCALQAASPPALSSHHMQSFWPRGMHGLRVRLQSARNTKRMPAMIRTFDPSVTAPIGSAISAEKTANMRPSAK